MSEQVQGRWWRRGRDESLHAAREAGAQAAEAMYDLDLLYKDLPAIMRAYEQSTLGMRAAAASGRSDSNTSRRFWVDWRALSGPVDAAIAAYLDLDASFRREFDYEEAQAASFRDRFDRVAQQMREQKPNVDQFRTHHDDALLAARNDMLAGPRRVLEAEQAQQVAGAAVAAMANSGLVDPVAEQALRSANTDLSVARAALSDQHWAEASVQAAAATATFSRVTERYRSVAERAEKVRSGFRSVSTRREGLYTQHERLAPVMSDLRRRYTYGSWKHVDGAPARIDTAMARVDAGITALGAALRATPLDVPGVEALLADIRTEAAAVQAIWREATDTVERLDAVSADPELLLVAVRRKALDARRFLSALPVEQAHRFAYTFDSLAARTENLAEQAKGAHPDWGQVIAEADAIEAGLDAMLRTVRSS